jgi:hypothetical protein
MQGKKIFILLPDGVGLRNFAFTNFHKFGIEKQFDITFWNATPFDLKELEFDELKIVNPKTHYLTDFYKKAQIQIELTQNIKKSKDTIYESYRFPFSKKNVKEIIKTGLVNWIIFWNNSQKGLKRIRHKITIHERKTKLYFDSLATLQEQKPAIVFCSNQRITSAVSSILAAQDLGIPTATFIFSWDNLPKGTKIIETDFYFVWSQHMKNELQYYYPHINENQIFITGTPQFESHFEKQFLIPKEIFFKEYDLDLSKKYICFSGDDVTTSPNDPQYLFDVAKAVETLKSKGYNLGIIFRRCPVDFSKRYDAVLENYKDIIVCINPKWEKIGESWNTILPTREDIVLQMNTIYHSEFVVNLGSSMVFDYVAFKKPCAFINYDVINEKFPNWSVKKIYNFIHFRSMPTKDSVIWLNSQEEIESKFESMLNSNDTKTVQNAQQWFEVINQHPPENSSERIWDAIEMIIKK